MSDTLVKWYFVIGTTMLQQLLSENTILSTKRNLVKQSQSGPHKKLCKYKVTGQESTAKDTADWRQMDDKQLREYTKEYNRAFR